MTQNLDLENWEKKQGSPKKPKMRREDNHISQQPLNALPKNLRRLYDEAMEGDEIIDIIIPPSQTLLSRLLPRLPFLLACCFFIFIIIDLISKGEAPMPLLLILAVPVFMITRLLNTPKKRFFLIGRKSFYYAGLMKRPIFYKELKDVQMVTATLGSQGGIQKNLLCFSFYDEVEEKDIASEALSLRYLGATDGNLNHPQNLAIYPHNFLAGEIEKAMHRNL